jgi:DNA-binding winged helix-turn-helix (wHTH) protein
MIHFDPDTLQASYAGSSLTLLPKEFSLFRHLYEHAGRSYTRDELLDAVWAGEAPVDRTVDDHIYRLRKKLAPWRHLVRIETIRGQGYKLTRRSPASPDSPLLQDEQFAADIRRMLERYQGLGMGAALELLLKHRDTLSLPRDPDYEAYLQFVRGEFGPLLSSGGIAPWQKLAYAAFIHSLVQLDSTASLRYFERLAAEESALSREWRSDVRLGLVSLCLEAGLADRAEQTLEAVRPDVAALDSPSFTAILRIREAMLHMHLDRPEPAAILLRECEELLERHPMQRERGAYFTAKAIFLYRQGDLLPARRTLEEAVDTMRQTLFVPHLLSAVRTILLFLGSQPLDEPTRIAYARQWDEWANAYRFDRLRVQAERLLDEIC